MKISFLTPHLNLAGGVKNILTFAQLLADRGHTINIVNQPPIKLNRTNFQLVFSYLKQTSNFSLTHLISYILRNTVPKTPTEWLGNKAKIYTISNLKESHMPDADIIVCAGGSDGPIVNTYGPEKGVKFVFFQHFGAHGLTREEETVAQMPFKKLVLASWIKELLLTRFGEESTLVRCPVDTKFFYPTSSNREQSLRVGMLYHTATWKGVSDGIKAFQIARQHVKNIKLVMFGCVGKPLIRYKKYCDFYYNPPQASLRDIYSSCDVWVCPSRTEGFGMTSAEAMACRCCLVTTDNGGSRDFAFHNETALVSPPRDVNILAENVILALNNISLRERLASNGYNLIQSFTWESATDILERTFSESLH